MDLKEPGALIYLLGVTRDELGGSELLRHLGAVGNSVPQVNPAVTLPLYRALHRAIQAGLVQSCHSPTKGGLAVALAKTAMGGELGLDVDLDLDPHLAPLPCMAALFSESNGRFVVSVAPDRSGAFEACMAGCRLARIGGVTAAPTLRIAHAGATRIDADVLRLKAAWKETFDAV